MPATIMDYFCQTFRRFMGLWLRFYAYFTGTVIKAQREKLRNLPKFTLVLIEPGLGLNDLTSEPACFTILPPGKEKSHRDIHHSDLSSLLTHRTVTWSQAEKALWVKPKAVVFTENSQDSSTLILTKWGWEVLLPPPARSIPCASWKWLPPVKFQTLIWHLEGFRPRAGCCLQWDLGARPRWAWCKTFHC